VQALYLQTFPHFFTQPWQVPPPLNVHHFWTLAIEEQFYLLWPLALRLMPGRRAATWMCLGVFAASFAYRAGSHAVLAPLTGNFLLLTHSGEFALGGWLAFVHRGAAWQRTRRWLMPVACLCGVLFVALTARHDFVMVTPMNFAVGLATISVAFAGLIAAALQPGVVQRLAGLGWLRWVGKISFGIYVYHLLLRALFEWIATRLTHTADGNKFLLVRLLVALVGTLVIAALSYSFYERPFLRFKRHFQAAGHPRSEATVRPVA
jgi:peptidoglycan/LPS O-acetylase OafA/YrhL